MNEILEFLFRHGAVVVFAAVFVEQVGVPLPAAPWLLAAGAFIGAGKMNWPLAPAAALFGSLVAGLIWFYLRRSYRTRLFKLPFRTSFEPGFRVLPTQDG